MRFHSPIMMDYRTGEAPKNSANSALILCAGYGTRLRPLTDIMPKPLLPVKGKPLLLSIISRLSRCGVRKFFVNTCHLHDIFEAELAKIFGNPDFKTALGLKKFTATFSGTDAEIFILPEYPHILDTGGALKNAVKYFGCSDSIIVHNGDIDFDADLRPFVEFASLADKNDAATICLRDDKNGNVCVRSGEVVDMRFALKADCDKTCAFTGLFVAHPPALRAASKMQADNFSSVDLFLKIISDGKYKIRARFENSGSWSDIGNYSAYLNANKNSSRTNFDRLALLCESGFEVRDPSFVDKGASTRHFIRFSDSAGKKLVACFYGDEKLEDKLYANIARFLHSCGISVPQISYEDASKRMFVMEDAGTDDLLEMKNRGADCAALYRSFVGELKKIHTFATERFAENPIETMPGFDENLYEWEQKYFFDNCITAEFNLDDKAPTEEFEELKRALINSPQTLIHRDAQSQNAMVAGGKVTLIDFQGMRFGSPMYDIASVLFDPYVKISDEEREELFVFYIGSDIPESEMASIRKLMHSAAVERLLQALGAYGFLSNSRGLKHYKKYFSPALESLQACALHAGFPKIRALALKCLGKLKSRAAY